MVRSSGVLFAVLVASSYEHSLCEAPAEPDGFFLGAIDKIKSAIAPRSTEAPGGSSAEASGADASQPTQGVQPTTPPPASQPTQGVQPLASTTTTQSSSSDLLWLWTLLTILGLCFLCCLCAGLVSLVCGQTTKHHRSNKRGARVGQTSPGVPAEPLYGDELELSRAAMSEPYPMMSALPLTTVQAMPMVATATPTMAPLPMTRTVTPGMQFLRPAAVSVTPAMATNRINQGYTPTIG